MNLEESVVSETLEHLTLASLLGKLLMFYYPWPTAYRRHNSRVPFLISVVTVCLCTLCPGNMHEPLPSKMDSSMSGSTIRAFRRCLPSRCLAEDAWLWLHSCGFQVSCHKIFYGSYCGLQSYDTMWSDRWVVLFWKNIKYGSERVVPTYQTICYSHRRSQ
jgi:hypothetical protein